MSLAHRIVFLIALAIIPLLAVQLVTGQKARALRIEQAEAGAVSRATIIALQQDAVFDNAFATLDILSAIPVVANPLLGAELCHATLQAATRKAVAFDDVVVTDAEGVVICSSNAIDNQGISFADRDWFRDIKAKPQERLIGEMVVSRLNGKRILPLAIARFENGQFAGAVSLGFDIAYLQWMLQNTNLTANVTAGLADRTGRIIATLPPREEYIGKSLFDIVAPLRDAKEPGTMRYRGESGDTWHVAYFPASLPPVEGLNLSISFNISELVAPLDNERNVNMLATLLSLAAALVIASFGARFFITRPVNTMRTVAERWAAHDFDARMRIRDHSSELAPLAASLNTMAEELSSSLHQKDLLLREINHRVMNSMQIISSLLMMQSRRLGQAAAAAPLMSAVERINALGTVHRRLHLSASIDTIELGSFTRELAADVGRALGGDHIEVTCRIEVWPLVSVDDAVAVGLILNEILTNAIKHSRRREQVNHVVVSLEAVEDGRIRLAVEDQGGGAIAADVAESASLGMIVIKSLASQLEAEVSFDTTAQGVRVSLLWRLEPHAPMAANAA